MHRNNTQAEQNNTSGDAWAYHDECMEKTWQWQNMQIYFFLGFVPSNTYYPLNHIVKPPNIQKSQNCLIMHSIAQYVGSQGLGIAIVNHYFWSTITIFFILGRVSPLVKFQWKSWAPRFNYGYCSRRNLGNHTSSEDNQTCYWKLVAFPIYLVCRNSGK